MLRKAAFAYEWYPGDPMVLRSTIESYLGKRESSEDVLGIVSPHAGYAYSGHVAGAVYGCVSIPDVAVVLSVNHRGVGSRAAIMCSGVWETPLGNTHIHEELARMIKEATPLLHEDSSAHLREHSLELQLPFLQYINPRFQLVPIALQQLRLQECKQIGSELAECIKTFRDQVILIASNDMTHFESREVAERKDQMAIGRILELDPEGLYTTVLKDRISMCGFVTTTVLLYACKLLGAKAARVVKYATSGEVTKDYSSVVGYAGILVK